MRELLLVLLIAQSSPPPIPVPAVADWIGTLEFTDSRGLVISRTDVRLVIGDDGTVSGSWRSRGGASGNIAGTLKAGKFKLKSTFYGGAEQPNAAGVPEVIAAERCKGETTLTGVMMRSTVIRLTSDRIEFDDPIKRATNRNCENARNVTWLLQPHDH